MSEEEEDSSASPSSSSTTPTASVASAPTTLQPPLSIFQQLESLTMTTPTQTSTAAPSQSPPFSPSTIPSPTSTPTPAPSGGSGEDPSSGTCINFSLPLDRKLGSLLDSGCLTDVEFLVGENSTSVRAHKLILAVGSPVFLRQFFGTLPSESSVRLPDIDVDSFRILLQYIYGGGGAVLLGEASSEGIETKTLPILYAAHKYDVRGLQELCALKLSLALNSWNVLSILHTAEMYCLPELGAKCWSVIQANTRSVLNFHQHSVDYATLLRIVKDDGLSIDEVKLFEFLNSWAENECERDEIVPNVDNKLRRLGETLRHVRFPTMGAGDFANRVAPKGLLSEEQVARVLTYICSSPGNRLFLHVDFPTTSRRRDQEASAIVLSHREQSSSSSQLSSHQPSSQLHHHHHVAGVGGGHQSCTFLNNPLAALLFPSSSLVSSSSPSSPLRPHPLHGIHQHHPHLVSFGHPPTSALESATASLSQQTYQGCGTLFHHGGGGPASSFMSYASGQQHNSQPLLQIQRHGGLTLDHPLQMSHQSSPTRASASTPPQHHRFSSRRGGSGGSHRLR